MPAQHVHRTVHVLGGERDVLDPLAVILAQVFLDLTLVVLRFVDRDADQAAGTGQGAREESRAFALDVEVADLAEVEQSLVEARPYVHAPAADVVRQVVDDGESRPLGQRGAAHGAKVHVIDRAIAVQVDEINQRAADALDRGNVELHGARAQRSGFRPELERAAKGAGGIAHAKRHGAGRRAVRARKSLREGLGLRVDDEIDSALAVERHVLRAMARHRRKAEPLEERPQQLRIRCRVFDELEAVRAHRVVVRVAHELTSRLPWLAGAGNPIRLISSQNSDSPRRLSSSGSELSSIRSGLPSWYARSSHSSARSLAPAAA